MKILPPEGEPENPIELWGDLTAQGIARAEIQNPSESLLYCMAITSEKDSIMGRPSSWSSAIDNLSFGKGDKQKLIILSAGNVSEKMWSNYPKSNYISSIENPGQSWNALTIGAYTEKCIINDQNFYDYYPIAQKGEISPHSRTSILWENKWPVKPDVVFEGGNLIKAPDGLISGHVDLELLSTSKFFNTLKPFDTINATSAASAQAAWFAAKIAFEYPDAWPETIRGLVIHSAVWNDAMKKQIGIIPNKKTDIRELMKVFGYGVPDLEKAINNRNSAFTYIAQEIIQHFSFNVKNLPETNEIHFFEFPWPKDLLLLMGSIKVRLRITLSYFIVPGPGELGYRDKYRYQSFGLRYELNNSGYEIEEFKKRINKAYREENEIIPKNSDSDRWEIGVNNRSHGSVHSDYIDSTAAEIATCNLIAVYPVIGWWRERKHLGKVNSKTRYSLIVSLESPEENVELYNTIKNLISIPIEIK